MQQDKIIYTCKCIGAKVEPVSLQINDDIFMYGVEKDMFKHFDGHIWKVMDVITNDEDGTVYHDIKRITSKPQRNEDGTWYIMVSDTVSMDL